MELLEILAGVYALGIFSTAMTIREFNAEDALVQDDTPRMSLLWAIVWPVFTYKCIKEDLKEYDNNK